MSATSSSRPEDASMLLSASVRDKSIRSRWLNERNTRTPIPSVRKGIDEKGENDASSCPTATTLDRPREALITTLLTALVLRWNGTTVLPGRNAAQQIWSPHASLSF